VVALPGGDELTAQLTAPGSAPPVAAEPSPLLPDFFYTSDWGLPVLAGVVGLLALIAAAFVLAAPKGTWLRGRLDPAAQPGFVTRCSRPGAAGTPGMCLYERRIENADLTVRFPSEWLTGWRAVNDGIAKLIGALKAGS